MAAVEQRPELTVRLARADDHQGIAEVARAHGFVEADSGVDERYLRFLEQHGRLVVAESGDGEVVAFGGAVDIGAVRLVSDLFVLESYQGRGVGARLLSLLVEGAGASMTFSSAHPRALPAYERVEMHPRWRLDYWRGTVPAGLERDDTGLAGLAVLEVAQADWRGDRLDLVRHWGQRDARLLHLQQGDEVVGWSIVNAPVAPGDAWSIDRLVTHGSHRAAMRATLAWLPSGAEASAVVPERSTAGTTLREAGFVVVDHDRCCTTDGTDVAPQVVALHPGLG